MSKAQRSESTIKMGKVLESIRIPTHRTDGTRILNRPTLVKVAQVLGSYTDHQTGANACPALSTLAALVQVSTRTIQRALDVLESLGIIRATLSHSWKLHRPTTWAFTRSTIDKCLAVAIAAAKERQTRYWAKLRAFQEARRFGRSSSGGQGVYLPSPPRGEREEGGSGKVGSGAGNPLFSILEALKDGRFVNPAT